MIGPISVDMKQAGERSAGKRPAAFDEAGAGNVATAAGLRPTAKAVELPPEPNVRAPVLDPTRLAPFRLTIHPASQVRECRRHPSMPRATKLATS